MVGRINAVGTAGIYWLENPPGADKVEFDDDMVKPPEEGKSYYLVSYSRGTNAIHDYENQLALILKNYPQLTAQALNSPKPLESHEMICQSSSWCVWLPPLLKYNGFSYDNDELTSGQEEWEDVHGNPHKPQIEMVSDITILDIVPTGISFESKKLFDDSCFGEFLSQKVVFKVYVKKAINIQRIPAEFQDLRADLHPDYYSNDPARMFFNYHNIFVFNNFELGYGEWWIFIRSGDEIRQVLNDHSEHCAGGDERMQISNIGIPLEVFRKLTEQGS